jgi:protocatechuate 3,4-dioxygenase beta subunit
MTMDRSGETPALERRAVLGSLLASGAVLSAGASSFAFSTACPSLPEETPGPFPADGSERYDRVANILAAPGVVRFDIRPSFGATSGVAPGIPLRLELTLLDRGKACQPLAGSAVYLWNCNRDGEYSLYGRGIEHENFLRGVQITNSEGQVGFQTIFPACYAGRYPHLHLEVFARKARLLNASTRVLTTQLTIPHEVCTRVYEAAQGYAQSAAQFKGLSPAQDSVFASSSSAELTLQTLATTGNLEAGFTGRANLGIQTPV